VAVSLPAYELSESGIYPSTTDSFSLIKITHNAKKTLIIYLKNYIFLNISTMTPLSLQSENVFFVFS